MDLEMRKFGRIMPHELNQVIKLIHETKYISATHAQMLLICCGSVSTDESKETRRNRLNELVPLLHSVLKLDISHFNAILKAHLENGAKVDISSFLGEMESNGISPNRVTYQHLIGLYCMEGNIAGATTVLEQMKQEDLAINESVFHLLLYGHTINKDIQSTRETQAIMEKTGLLMGTEMYTWMLLAAARSKDWNRVEELFQEANDKEIKLDSSDYFRLIVALCENGMGGQAEALLDKIPKRAGYFTEMRNNLPQIVFAGQVNLADMIYNQYQEGGVTDTSGDLSGRGIFLSRVLGRSDADANKCAEIVVRMYKNGFTDQLKTYLMCCIDRDKDQHINMLKQELAKEGIEKLEFGQFDSGQVIRGQVNVGLEEADRAIKVLQDFGIRIPYRDIAKYMIQRNLDLDSALPGTLFFKLVDSVKTMQNGLFYNQIISYLLFSKTLQHQLACSGFILHVNRREWIPRFWIDNMAASATATSNTENIINTIFVAKMICKEESDSGKIDDVYGVLNLLGSDMLRAVLLDINTNKLGVPRKIADMLKTQNTEKDIEEMLNQSVLDFENVDIWTDEAEQKFLDKRKADNNKSYVAAGFKLPQSRKNMYRGRLDIPESVEEMENIKSVLNKRGEVNSALENSLVKGYADNNSPELAVAEIENILREKPSFQLHPTTIDVVVKSFTRNDKAESGLKFFAEYSQTNSFDSFFANTYTDLCIEFAKKGEHSKVLDMIQQFPQDKKAINKEPDRCFFSLLKVYEDKGDPEKMQEIIDECVKLYNTKREKQFFSRWLVNSSLLKDDIEGAILTFGKIASKDKFLACRDELLSRLVVDENLKDLQRVIDICIKVVGEELTLYTLATVFLKEGRRQQAKKMLETPGLKYSHKQIDHIMNFFIQDQRINCVKDFVLFSKNIFGCDRDHMYWTWVNAVKEDASEVQEIWIEIQEEGLMPSNELKVLIAKALKSANQEIPFDTTDLELDKEAKKKETKSDEVEKPKQIAEKPKVDKVTASPEDDEKSALWKLVKDNKFDEVAQLLKDRGYPHEKLGRQFCSFITLRMVDHWSPEKTMKFLQDLPPGSEAAFKQNSNISKLQLNLDDDTFLNNLRSMELGKDRAKYCLSINVVNDKIQKDPQFLGQLEALSNEGCGAATVVLARHACHQQNSQQFSRFWNLDTRENREEVAREMLVSIKNLESLQWISGAVNNDVNVLRDATNMCLANDKNENDQKIVEFALTNGLSFDVLNTAALKRISSLPEFNQHRDEIKSILDSRNKK